MVCTERERLERLDVEAGARFDAANEQLRTRIRISPKEEFVSLSRAVNETWETLMQARIALDRHLRDHGCERARSIASSVTGTRWNGFSFFRLQQEAQRD